jgi:tRNA(Ile)-lysidine synthase
MFDATLLAATLDRLLADADVGERRYCVAFSGGVDSTALLHALAEVASVKRRAAIRALHVNHHLQPRADEWAAQAQAFAGKIGVGLKTLDARVQPKKGESLEAVARSRRYELLSKELAPGEILLTAHQRDDQLETFLLQLLRGAGVSGLAAMPARVRFALGWHLRPLLDVPRTALRDYLERSGLTWTEDTSNADLRFDRNFLRQSIVPALRQRWPGAAANVARSAAHMAEARDLLDEMARMDLMDGRDGNRLQCPPLRALDAARARNAIRYWLREQGFALPSAARLEQIVGSVLHARSDAMPVVRWPAAEVRRYRDRLYAMSPLPPAPQAAVNWDWKRQPDIDLGPGTGTLRLIRAGESGLRLREPPCPLRIEWRRPAGKLRPEPKRPARSLRYLFQEAGLVPWMRNRAPLLVANDRLIAIGDLYVDAEFQPVSDQPRLTLEWNAVSAKY